MRVSLLSRNDTMRGSGSSMDAAQSFGCGMQRSRFLTAVYPMQLSASSRANKGNIVRENDEGECCSEEWVENGSMLTLTIYAAATGGLKSVINLRNGPGSGAQRADRFEHAMADEGAGIHAMLVWVGVAIVPKTSVFLEKRERG